MKILVAIIVCIALLATTFGITWRDAYSGIESVVSVTSDAVEKISSAFLPNAFKESWNDIEQGEVNGIDIERYLIDQYHIEARNVKFADYVFTLDYVLFNNDELKGKYFAKVMTSYRSDNAIVVSYLCLNGTISIDGASYKVVRPNTLITRYYSQINSSSGKLIPKTLRVTEENITLGDYIRGLNNE